MELSPTGVVTRSALTLPTSGLLCEFASGLGRGSGDSVINHPDFSLDPPMGWGLGGLAVRIRVLG
ncbi:MAG: hypothetical protein O2892_19340, partial [Actinomycetota bacterium]|nr:hypothetical protein [Actinomycetota bacterium]